jgi:hypothetical protein
MRGSNASESPRNLRDHVPRNDAPTDAALGGIGHRHRWIEMCA